MTKLCTVCKVEKPIDQFSKCGKHSRNSKYRYNFCNPCRASKQAAKRYGLTQEAYDAMPKTCEICGVAIGCARYKRLYVDHSHETGKVRGRLCLNCNVGLGNFQDSLELLKKALKYLEERENG